MEKEELQERRARVYNELYNARVEVAYRKEQLRENLDTINSVLRRMKKTRKVIKALKFIQLNWNDNKFCEEQLEKAKKTLLLLSHTYDVEILKRKLLKNKFKEAQRKFSTKWKKTRAFDRKHFLGENQNGKR